VSDSYRVSDSQVGVYSATSLEERIAWLDDIRETTWQLATPEVRKAWAAARGRTVHPAPESLEIDANIRARVWRGDAEALSYAVESVMTLHLGAAPRANSVREPRELTLEFERHLGPRMTAALLGGSFRPSQGGDLTVRIHVGRATGPRWPGSLMSHAIVGLHPEFVAGVSAAAEHAVLLGPGELDLNRAAYDEVGSSCASFERATRALIEALAVEPESVVTALCAALGR